MEPRPRRPDFSGLPGRWIVVEGFDGSGKSSASRLVAEAATDIPIIPCSHKEIGTGSERIEKTMREVASLLWPKEDLAFVRSLPSEYRVHLHASWYNLYVEFVLKPRLAAGQTILLDSWIYKFFAHLVVYGYDADYLDVIFAHVPEPDVVVLLEPPVEAVWGRREFGSVELGVYMDYPELGRDSFIHYQSLIRDALRDLGEAKGWSIVRPSAADSPDAVAAEVEARIRSYLPRPAASAQVLEAAD